jgi:bacillithiol system protein YtxJ
MKWIPLTDTAQVERAIAGSEGRTIGFFKHSTRCSISRMALRFLEEDWEENSPLVSEWYFVDLLAHRSVSNQLAESLREAHESPQLLLVRGGECIYEASHDEIRADRIAEFLRGVG